MKTKHTTKQGSLAAGWMILVLMVTMLAQTASSQTGIEWMVLGSTATPSSSSGYTVNDTLGQTVASSTASASYRIISGFYALENMGPASGLPALAIALVGPTTVQIWWPSPSTGFVLQQNSDVSNAAGWSDVSVIPSDDGVIKSINVRSTGTSRFFRLRRP